MRGGHEGQTCYICTEAVHWKTKEGLVRGCACHTTEGFVHVSCLLEQAKILVAEAEENNLDDKAMDERWELWFACNLCEQGYHGVVRCALGWACWKTYLGRPETDQVLGLAMSLLADGLLKVKNCKGALEVCEVYLDTCRRYPESEDIDETIDIYTIQSNCLSKLGMHSNALEVDRRAYKLSIEEYGDSASTTFTHANNLACSLINLGLYSEAKTLLYKSLKECICEHGDEHYTSLRLRETSAQLLYKDPEATEDDLLEAEAMLGGLVQFSRQRYGANYPGTVQLQTFLDRAKLLLKLFRARAARAASRAVQDAETPVA